MRRSSTAITSRPTGLGCVVLSLYSLLVSYRRYSVTDTLATIPVALLLAYVVIRIDRGMPRTLRGAGAGGGRKRRKVATKKPRFQLVLHPINHFGEKLRWILDLVGAEYEETNVGAIFLFLLRGRSVPWLVDRYSHSIIGNSDEAVAYVGAVVSPENALCHRTKETVEWESALNRLGHAIQGFAYSYVLEMKSSEMSLTAWGAYETEFVPWIDRTTLKLSYPLLRRVMMYVMRTDSMKEKYRSIIEEFLDQTDAILSRSEFLVSSRLTYVDIAMASLLAPLMPDTICFAKPKSKYAGGRFASFSQMQSPPPPPLADFERKLLDRPTGKAVVRLYDKLRR